MKRLSTLSEPSLLFSRYFSSFNSIIGFQLQINVYFIKTHFPCRSENSAPVITVPPVSQTGRQGANVTLSCAFKGSPKPQVIWYRGGKRIEDATGDATVSVKSTETSSELCIQTLEARHVGEYTVSIRNTYGEDLASAEVKLKCETLLYNTNGLIFIYKLQLFLAASAASSRRGSMPR